MADKQAVPSGCPVPGETYTLDPARERDEFCFYCCTDLMGCIGVDFNATAPDHPQLPEVVVYCPNSDCVAREVVVAMKLFGDPQPQKFYYPVCRKGPMNFHGYRQHRTLFPTATVAKLEAERSERAAARPGPD
jgi:hypothetical protein